MTTTTKTKTEKQLGWARAFNHRVTNPIMMKFAGRWLYTVVEHVGRRSHRTYHTPVLGQTIENGFVIPLPYGTDTDWCLNILAVNGCSVQWHGNSYRLTAPQIVEQAAGERAYSPLFRFMLHAAHVEKYMILKR